MTTPVNLNKYRKEKARAENKARADQNAVAFGRTKAEKDLAKKQRRKLDQDLDGRKLDK
ncbi:DUF4169 family protein [Ruegeria sp. Ofav3-42]|uniref:DUF4169 family protein n=1 Tax=Ruegeria sp. Ofav3-42 TaxID=2917759 RepID=UPI001EF4D546|nr:DUF4169 family protein [Ruegeria sp. Ofav3-42]MCG7518384.1 DUF4169 family protein [Ruegeria sp. Ofav3-42]